MNDHDVLVGQQLNTAIKWSPTRGVIVLGPEGTPGRERLRAFNINDREQVVGEWQHINLDDGCGTGSDAVLWQANGAQQLLERLRNDTDAIALGINDDGLVVGNSRSATGCTVFEPDRMRAAIWHDGRITDLNTLLKNSVAREIQLIQASDINDRGQIAAIGFYRNQPLDNCWDFVFNPDTGEFVYDTTLRCRSIHAFLMTPKEK
jgi:probable HAF family extracellular repeat protein